MEQKEFVAALDLGTSKMLVVAASKHNDGTISVLGSEKMPSGNCIRRGCVYNIEETTTNVKTLISRLGFKVSPGIKKIYVGIGGQSLCTESYSVKKEINGLITEETLAYLRHECEQYQPDFAQILEIVAPEYYVDGNLVPNPKGVICKEIEAKFQLILGRPSLKNYLTKSIEDAEIEIAGYFISPLATAEESLTKEEKELGCALVEFGAGVTYLSIYQNGWLKHLVTIPLGGNVITKDLCDLKVPVAEAEELKIKEGNAIIESGKEEELLNTIVEARINEIVANVVKQIKESGYEQELSAGIILTGGGSLLKNLDKLLEQKTGKKIRKRTSDPTLSCALGLLKLGKENCALDVPKVEVVQMPISTEDVKPPVKYPEPPKPPREGLFSKLKKETKKATERVSHDLFGDFNDTDTSN
jgi:cell division protein FtsA